METADQHADSEAFDFRTGKFDVRRQTIVIPEMSRMGSRLFAAVLRGFGLDARVMETYKGLELGKEFTSGKECYPCQVTMGDILYFLQGEAEARGADFDVDQYAYFMPEAGGPCRFGMYNKYQRIVLDSFPRLSRLRIVALTTEDGYSLAGLVDRKWVTRLRKTSYIAVVVADILDRLLWRIRPYEKAPGQADRFIEEARQRLESLFEGSAATETLDALPMVLADVVREGRAVIDEAVPPRPLIGVVGEIYLRTHVKANQDTIRLLEKYGAEVVNASLAEWINYTTYDRLRVARQKMGMDLRRLRLKDLLIDLKDILRFQGDLMYQESRQRKIYAQARRYLDIATDHRVADLDRRLEGEGLFSFDIGTEACLSIPCILEYVREGFNGIVNIFPFTCMPSTITSAIIKPLMAARKIPYLDTPYDASLQPGREATIRTFMYQAHQHFLRHGRRAAH